MTSRRQIASTGMDRVTGKAIFGWPHVEQALGILFTTNFGERVMREWVGSSVPAMLGRNLSRSTVLSFYMAVWMCIEAFEPRYRITRFRPLTASRDGRLRLEIDGLYRPRGHLGDFTVEGERRVSLGPVEARSV